MFDFIQEFQKIQNQNQFDDFKNVVFDSPDVPDEIVDQVYTLCRSFSTFKLRPLKSGGYALFYPDGDEYDRYDNLKEAKLDFIFKSFKF